MEFILKEEKPTQRSGYAERKQADKERLLKEKEQALKDRVQTLFYVKGEIEDSYSPLEYVMVINNYGNAVESYKIDLNGNFSSFLTNEQALDRLDHLNELRARNPDGYHVVVNKGSDKILMLSVLTKEMIEVGESKRKGIHFENKMTNSNVADFLNSKSENSCQTIKNKSKIVKP